MYITVMKMERLLMKQRTMLTLMTMVSMMIIISVVNTAAVSMTMYTDKCLPFNDYFFMRYSRDVCSLTVGFIFTIFTVYYTITHS